MTTAELVDRYAAAVVALRIAENRLAKVPALVDALRGFVVIGLDGNLDADRVTRAAKALAEWEQA